MEFSKIIKNESLRVIGVKHSTNFDVTKEGTFGAISTQSGSRSKSKTVDIDKPFLFFVRDTELDVFILAGVYADPDA